MIYAVEVEVLISNMFGKLEEFWDGCTTWMNGSKWTVR